MGKVLFCCNRTLDKLKLAEVLKELYPPLAPDAPELLEDLNAMDEADDLEPYDEPYEHERK